MENLLMVGGEPTLYRGGMGMDAAAILDEAVRLKSSEHLLIYADALGEAGDPLADGFREIGAREWWPGESDVKSYGFLWWDWGYWESSPGVERTPADMDGDVFEALEGGESNNQETVLYWPSVAAALTAAATAYSRVARKEVGT